MENVYRRSCRLGFLVQTVIKSFVMPLKGVTQRLVATKIVSTKILWRVQAQTQSLFSYSVELMEAVVAWQLLVVLCPF